MSNGAKIIAYSECDTYDWHSDYQFRSKASRCSLKSKRHRRELTVEICELLVKFAEYSRHDSTLACRYLSHPMIGGLFIYIPFVRTKLRTGSLPVDVGHEGDHKRTNHKFRSYLDVVPDTQFYFRLRNAKIDVSYARMVKKPPVQSCFVEKEEMWGSRYPNKRYQMNDSIRYSLLKILHIVTDKFKRCFPSELVRVPFLFFLSLLEKPKIEIVNSEISSQKVSMDEC